MNWQCYPSAGEFPALIKGMYFPWLNLRSAGPDRAGVWVGLFQVS